jgi:RNA polymerase primary sigma factor
VVETEEDFEEEAVEKDYEELRVKTLDSLNAVRKVSASLKDLYDKARHVGADPEKQKKLRKQIDTVRGQVVDKMESVNLHGVLKDRMTQRVRDLNLLFRQAEREVTSCQRRLGVGGEAGAELLEKVVPDPQGCAGGQAAEPASPKRFCRTSRSTIRLPRVGFAS